jgi:hypothetical protein
VLACGYACLAVSALTHNEARAQTPANGLQQRQFRDDLTTPEDLPQRRIGNSPETNREDIPNDELAPDGSIKPAPSRIGAIPTYGLPAANGASDTGYDSLNRKRKKPKFYPGQRKPKPAAGPGSPIPTEPATPTLTPPRLSISPSSTANRTPIAPALAGTVAGQPTRRRLKLDDDPFGAIGDYAGSFLIKSAIELSGGYDSNPGRFVTERGSPFYLVAPELVVMSDWTRHALVADLRGSFSGYGNTFPPPTDGTIAGVPTNVDRPDFTGHIDGRLDASRDTRFTGQARMRIATDNPGSPNIQAGLAKYPVFVSTGATLGIDQTFNRLQISGGATFDHIVYQDSKLTNGISTSNADRNFDQYGGIARVSYDVMPGLKPFGEIQGDTRIHDTFADRFGYRRDSTGGYIKAGTTFELTRLVTGEIAVGYTLRGYQDSRLDKLQGLLTSALVAWSVTPLTTAKFLSETTVAESTLAGVPGVLVRTYTAEVDHDFRRWLTGIGKFTYGTLDYQGSGRVDNFFSISGDLIYKLNRSLWVKATLRRDWLNSNVAGGSNASTVAMLGVRLQN